MSHIASDVDALESLADTLHHALREPDEVVAARFEELALALYRAQRSSIPAYDAWCAHERAARGGGDDGPVTNWRDIPALPIAAFKQLDVAPADALSRDTFAATFHSSGTTSDGERPSMHRLVTTDLYDASLDAGVTRALLPDVAAGACEPIACVQLQPDAQISDTSSLTHMFDRIRLGDLCRDEGVYVEATWRVDAEGCWSKLDELAARHEPVLVLATSFALAELLERARDLSWERLTLPPRSRVVDTGGYKGRSRELTRAQLVAQIEDQLGVPAAMCENEYGMSELSSQAWLGTVAHTLGYPLGAGPRWTPPWLRVRVVDPVTLHDVNDGESGLLVFHDLANVWSCAAVRSDDLGIRRGDSFELVGRAPGATLKGCSLRIEQLRA